MKHKAMLYTQSESGVVVCNVCAHHCRIIPDSFGICGVRRNVKGILYTYVYGLPIAMHVDPVEKKPLYHFLPGSNTYSIATIGCNFRCGFCQNWEISQLKMKQDIDSADSKQQLQEIAPEVIVQEAIDNDCQSISYTYTEPTIFLEYAYDISRLARQKGLKNIFVTNGYMTLDALEIITPYLDAVNIDLKFFSDESYQKHCGGKLKPVLDSIQFLHKHGIWVELTTLIVPGENDSEAELTSIAKWIASISFDIPWHVSRFYPHYEMSDKSPTDIVALELALLCAQKAGVRYVYPGNVVGFSEDTACPQCQKVLLQRQGLLLLRNDLDNGKCPLCGFKVEGIFG